MTKLQTLVILTMCITLFLLSCGDENPLNPDEQNQRGTISGTVVNQFDKPIVGVSITTNKEGFNSNSLENGTYTIPDIESDLYTLTFSKSGYFDTTMDTTIAISKMAEIINIDMTMYERTGTLIGTVTDTNGTGINSTDITLSSLTDSSISEITVNTGTDEHFTIGGIPLGIYKVQCTHADYTALATPLCTLTNKKYTDTIALTMSYNGGGAVGTITGTLKSGPGAVATLTSWGVSVLGTELGVTGTAETESVPFTISNVPAGTYNLECTDLKHTTDTVKAVSVAVGETTDLGTITLTDDGTKWMNRSVLGQFESHRDTVDTVIIEVKGEGIPNWTPFDCDYNKTYGTLSGVVLVPESGQAWEVRAKAFIRRNDSLIKIGQSKDVEFNKSSGDVELTEFVDPTNAIPTISINPITEKNKINTEITFTATTNDAFDNQIKSVSWRVGEGTSQETDTLKHTFTKGNISHTIIATIYDIDDNYSSDTLSLLITDNKPTITITQKPDIAAIDEKVEIRFTASDDGNIVSKQYSLETDSLNFIDCDTDSSFSFLVPDYSDNNFRIKLRLTDDDERTTDTTLTMTIGLFHRYFGDGKSYRATSIIETPGKEFLISGTTKEPTSLLLIKTDFRGKEIWSKTYIEFNNGTLVNDSHTEFLLKTSESRLLKINMSGNIIWAKDYSDILPSALRTIIKCSDGNFILSGALSSPMKPNIDPSVLVWLVKIDGNGSLLWEKSVTFGVDGTANSTIQTNDGGFMVGGSIYTNGNNRADQWLIKFDSEGNKIWDKTCGYKDKTDEILEIKQYSDNSFVILSLIDFWQRSIFRIDSEGNELWSHPHENTVSWNSFIVSSDDMLLLTGSEDKNSSKKFRFKYLDINGTKKHAKTFDSFDESSGTDVVESSDGGFVFIGNRIFPSGEEKIFLIKSDKYGNTAESLID